MNDRLIGIDVFVTAVEAGTFAELVAKGGHFAALARAQFLSQEAGTAKAVLPEGAGLAET